MRLGKEALGYVDSQVRKALSGECVVTVKAPSLSLARRMYMGVRPHIEERGGVPNDRRMSWALPNGSEIRVVVD